MIVCENGKCKELTAEEVTLYKIREAQAEREYWFSIPYDEAVNAEIRKRYTESQEFAVLRQKETKPEEYTAYFAFCEECKAYIKGKKEEITNGQEVQKK